MRDLFEKIRRTSLEWWLMPYSGASASALMFSCGYISCWHQGRLSGGPKGPLCSFLWLHNYSKIKKFKNAKTQTMP